MTSSVLATPTVAKVSYREVLRNRNFALLWSGRSVSLVGDLIYTFSINWLILEKTGSALQVGGNLALTMIGDVVFGTLAGVIADKWNRRRLMIASDIARGILLLGLALMLSLFPFDIWHIYIISFVLTSISSLFTPAYQATIPNVLAKDALVAGRSLSISSARLLQTVASATSGLVIAIFGAQLGIVLNALSFLLSALAIALATFPQVAIKDDRPLSVSTLIGNTVDGWKLIRRQAVLMGIFLLFTLGDFGAAFTWPVHVVFAEKVLGGGPQLYGYLATSSLLGGFVGALFIGRNSRWFTQRAGFSYALAAFSWGVLSIFFGVTSSISLALAFRFFIGFALSMIHVPIASLLDVNVTDHYRGRIWAAVGIGSSLVTPISVALSGLAADHWSPRVSYLIAGLLLIMSASLAITLPGIRRARIE